MIYYTIEDRTASLHPMQTANLRQSFLIRVDRGDWDDTVTTNDWQETELARRLMQRELIDVPGKFINQINWAKSKESDEYEGDVVIWTTTTLGAPWVVIA